MRLCLLGLLGGVVVVTIFDAFSDLHVWRGLVNLARPHPPAVASNPGLPQLTGHRVSWVTDIHDQRISESSGLTVSALHSGVLYTVNDSGNDPILFALDESGHTLAELGLPITAADIEAMDAYADADGAHILVADVGDNLRWRPHIWLHVFAEPAVLNDQQLHLSRSIQVSLPNGPRDIEAVAIDRPRNRVLLLSKRHYPPELFSIPLSASGAVTAMQLQDFPNWPRPTELDLERNATGGQYKYMPGGMDIAGQHLLITTYKPLLLIDLAQPQEPPRWIDMPEIGQREAISFIDGSDRVALFTRERSRTKGYADVFRIELPANLAAHTAASATPPR